MPNEPHAHVIYVTRQLWLVQTELRHHLLGSGTLSPSRCALEYHASNHAGCNGETADNCHAHQAFLCDSIVDQALQACCLQVLWFQVEQKLIVASRLRIVTQFIVAECEVI